MGFGSSLGNDETYCSTFAISSSEMGAFPLRVWVRVCASDSGNWVTTQWSAIRFGSFLGWILKSMQTFLLTLLTQRVLPYSSTIQVSWALLNVASQRWPWLTLRIVEVSAAVWCEWLPKPDKIGFVPISWSCRSAGQGEVATIQDNFQKMSQQYKSQDLFKI